MTSCWKERKKTKMEITLHLLIQLACGSPSAEHHGARLLMTIWLTATIMTLRNTTTSGTLLYNRRKKSFASVPRGGYGERGSEARRTCI